MKCGGSALGGSLLALGGGSGLRSDTEQDVFRDLGLALGFEHISEERRARCSPSEVSGDMRVRRPFSRPHHHSLGVSETWLCLSLFRKAHRSQATVYPKHWQQGRGQGGFLSYWKLERKPFPVCMHRLFLAREGDLGTAPLCSLGCFSHLCRQCNNERELGNFQKGN